MFSYFETVLNYYKRLPFAYCCILLGLGLLFLVVTTRRKHYNMQHHAFIGMMLVLAGISGGTCTMLLYDGAEFRRFLLYWILLTGAEICVFLVPGDITLRNMIVFGFIMPILPILIAVVSRLFNWNDKIELLYCFYGVLRICGLSLLLSILLYRLLQKMTRNEYHEIKSRLTTQGTAASLAVLLLLFAPSDLYYVNCAGIGYGGELKIIDRQVRSWIKPTDDEEEITETPPVSAPAVSQTTLDAPSILYKKKAYTYPFDTKCLSELKIAELNIHRIPMTFLSTESYDNSILQETCKMMENYHINPSYLFSKILMYGSNRSDAFSAPEHPKLEPVKLPEFVPGDNKAYAKSVFLSILQSMPSLQNISDIPDVGNKENVYFTYLTICDTSSVQSITLYLHIDDSKGMTGVDYSVLQWFNLNSENEIVYLDHAVELEAIYDASFSDLMHREFTGGDMILTKGEDMVYFKKSDLVCK